jgi:hypothetical protein
VTSVCGDESVLANVDSSLRGRRQIQHVRNWECCKEPAQISSTG